jgi:hypothetical protein
LAPNEKVEIIFYGIDEPVLMTYGKDEKGRVRISFCPSKGYFEIVHEGKIYK